jgi:hypothetical protein
MAYLIRHHITEKHDMSRINLHVVLLHRVLNFIDDGHSGCLDTQHFGNLNDVVGGCALANNSLEKFQ